jgi:RNA-binding protein
MSDTLSGSEKRALKARAQLLEAVVRIGQAGMTDAVVSSLDNALDLHSLVKVRFADFKEDRHILAPELAKSTHSVLVQQVGNVAVFYRPKSSGQDTEE